MSESWREMGLKEEEYRLICRLLGREPNYLETGIFAVMWSEHCSYKNSKAVLKRFPNAGPRVLQGPGENAGAVDIGDGQAVVFKIESHNHPSAIEPFQGAATGVGGIVRDVFAMGARPVAILDSLRFGPLEDEQARYLFNGVVGGIGWYGNCLGIPTVGGEVYFDFSYLGNPLVNAMCVGVIDQAKLAHAVATGVGNAVMLVGARTGRDGIHGATFASEELSAASSARRPAVQVGDPFMEKLLLEACLELIDADLVLGLQDLGAAGLTSSAAEMAARGHSGLDLEVALVPRREEGLTPYEVMLSESQERMLVVPQPDREDEVRAIFERWGLEATVIGRVTGDGLLRVRENGRVVAEVPVRLLTEECPVYQPPSHRPAYLDQVQAFDPLSLPPSADLGRVLLDLLGSPNLASREWVWRQYDHQVRTATVVKPGAGDAALLRLKGSTKALALTTDCNGRYVYLDPYWGGAIAVAEAARNLVASGAEPLAVTDCLNFGNPEKPEVYWQFEQAVEGIAAACRALNTPVVSGNVSFYNETSGLAVYPTPVIGMVGLVADLERRVSSNFKDEGDLVYLLGTTWPELGGSEYLALVCGVVAGRPPRLDLEQEAALQGLCLKAARAGLLKAAHDCAEGGLAVALAECCLQGGLGARLDLEGQGLRRDVLLFSESQSRVVVAVSPGAAPRLEQLAAELEVPCHCLGRVGGEALVIAVAGTTVVNLSLKEMERKWRQAIPQVMA